jgi:dTDP-4-amino-4,6-dideoxygalactose transaminase
LCVKLKHLDAWSDARLRNAKFYDAAFAKSGLGQRVLTPPPARGRSRHIYNQYVIRAARRDELRKFLADNDIGTEIYYPVPLHMQECFKYLGHKAADFPESARAAQESLALPIYPELVEAQLQHVVDTIVRFYGESR